MTTPRTQERVFNVLTFLPKIGLLIPSLQVDGCRLFLEDHYIAKAISVLLVEILESVLAHIEFICHNGPTGII